MLFKDMARTVGDMSESVCSDVHTAVPPSDDQYDVSDVKCLQIIRTEYQRIPQM